MYKNFFLPAGILSGTIIGAGVFALPYVFKSSGILLGLLFLGISIWAFCLIHLMYADIIKRTPGNHRFVGYTKMYLGKYAFISSIFIGVVEMILVMVIYLILSESFINLIYPEASQIFKVLIFWLLGSFAIFFNVKKLAFTEFLITGGIIVIIISTFIYGFKNLFQIDFTFPFFSAEGGSAPGGKNIFFPLGPILFALSGSVAIPSLVDYFRILKSNNSDKNLKKSVSLGTIIPGIVYAIFIFGVLSLSKVVSEDSVSGLIGNVSPIFLFVLGILGILCLWSSYIVVGLNIFNILRFDLKIRKSLRFFMVVFLPIILYVAGLRNFILLTGIIGGIFLSIECIFIILIWLKMNRGNIGKSIFKRQNNISIVFLFLIFSIAIIFELKNWF
ncbi:MAG: hypothetical protein EXS49_01250 [Candidatus Pacebacteria bacterium]|nr:hypothetical protein [Candidatus Paceibacterota bacterium]